MIKIKVVLACVSVAWMYFSCGYAAAQAAGAGSGNSPPVKEVQIPAEAFSSTTPVPAWVEPASAPATSRTEPLVVRLADTQFRLESVPAFYVHRAYQINDTSALTEAGQIPIAFVPEYQTLQLHFIRIVRGPDVLDRTSSSPVRFLRRETGLERGVYSDVVTASALVSDVRVGDTLEYAYSVRGQNPVLGGKYSETAGWDQLYPIEQRRVIISYPQTRKIGWKFVGDGKFATVTPQETSQSGMRRLVFEQRSMDAVRAEPFVPSDYFAYRMLQFSEFSDWNDVARWAQGLFQINAQGDTEFQEIVDRLKKYATPEERVVAALQFVQSEVRYFSVSLGESSHRPAPPSVVLRNRYGDCKDKTLLLMALLRQLDIQSKPVLLNVQSPRGWEKTLPSPLIFDHVILQVATGGATYYLDPTRYSQVGRLDRMGQVHEGAKVLVVDPDSRNLVTISSPNALELNRSELSEVATLPKFGAEGILETRETWYGVAAEGMRMLLRQIPAGDMNKAFESQVESRYSGARLDGNLNIDDDQVGNVLTVSSKYKVPKFAEERAGNWLVRISAVNFQGTFAIPASTKRTSPLVIPRFPFQAKYTFEIRLPVEVSAVRDPITQTVKNNYFSYAVFSSFRGNLAKTSIELKTIENQIATPDVEKTIEDLRKGGKIPEASYIWISAGDVKKTGTLAFAAKEFSEIVKERLRDIIDKITATIQSGKLAGNDLANAHCQRSNANSDLGNFDSALREANEAIRLAPNSTESLTCRAAAFFASGEFQKSIADYSKALALGATDSNTYYRRGVAKFYLDRFEEAAEDLAKASELDGEDMSRMYMDLWLAWTSRRLGKPVPDSVMRRARAEPRGDWPRPALAMVSGNMQPEEMLKLLERKSGDDLLMARAEGYFYLGQHYLLAGDKAKAREYFEKTRQLGVLMYTEHVASGFELAKLKTEK